MRRRLLPLQPASLCVLLTMAFPAAAGDLEVRSTIDAVTVYPDGATVTRTIRADLPAGDGTLVARDFPPSLDPSSLRVEGAGAARIVIAAIDAKLPRAEKTPMPELDKRLEALRDRKATIDDRIAAANARKGFVQRFADHVPLGLGDKAEARPLVDWRAAFAGVGEEIAAADTLLREARRELRDVDRDIAALEAERRADPPRKMEVRIDLTAGAAGPATFRVAYTVRGARWVPLYDARLDAGGRDRKPTLELVRRAEVIQRSGEDWSDVTLSASTVRTAKGGNAPDLVPLTVRYFEPRPAPPAGRADGIATSAPRPRAVPESAKAAAPAPAEEREAQVDSGGFQTVFRIPGRVSVGGDGTAKSFRISTATIAPELLVRAVPALDDTAYLEASFRQAEDAPVLPGRVALYRDGVFVGRGALPLVPKDETVRLGFGADDKIKVVRSLVRKTEGTAGLIGSSKTDEREFKTTIRNGHDTAIRVVVEDQVPVGEAADIQVELLPVTTAPTERDVRDRRGVLAWRFEAAAGEARDIRLGWRMRWPADKSVVFEPRRP